MAPAVKRLLPPASSSGARSSMSTDTPLSAAASAAENAAFPAPTTTTSADDGNMYVTSSFSDSAPMRRIDRGAGRSYTSGTMAATTHSLAALNALPTADFASVLADVFEHAPWVAERAAAGRP